MTKILIWNDKSGNMIYTIPGKDKTPEEAAAKCLPSGTSYSTVEHTVLPTDKTFRSAWERNGTTVDINLAKAKVQGHILRREKRAEEFIPHDDIIAKQIPGSDTSAAETARAAIRTKYATMQTNIDNATNVDGIKSALDA